MVDVAVNFTLENEDPINAEFTLEPDVTFTAVLDEASTKDHNGLYNRDMADQHPISAITGLESALSGLDGRLTAEISRAVTTEELLSDAIDAEETRATGVEDTLSSQISANHQEITNHVTDKNNPHEVTKAQVGLGNVDNTSDLDKPISTATQTALNGKVDKVSTANKVYGTDSQGEQTTYDTDSFGKVDDVKVGGVSVVTNKIAELGTMASETASNYYTASQIDSTVSGLQDSIDADHQEIGNIGQTIGAYGDIVTHDVDEFATASQGALADSALQAGDNVSELNNDAGYITSASIPTNYVTTDTAQTITGTKTFNNCAIETNNFINLTSSIALLRYAGSGVYRNLVKRNSSGDVEIGNTSDPLKTYGSGARPKYNGVDLALYNDVSTETSNRQTADNNLQSQINDLKSRGHFLALWDCSTGLAETNPPSSPYTYQAGDFFIVGTVSTATPPVNYMPDGSTYTTGVASTTVEMASVDVDDTYYYDGTTWKLQVNTEKTTAFVNIAGSPYDNTNLASALNAKADTSSLATVATSGAYSDLSGTPEDLSDFNNDVGYITGVNSSDVTTALGYTPVNPSNLATVATSGSYSDLSSTPTVDQTYDSTSTNAQSGTAVASAISTKANDSDVVKLTGNQTVAGTKTFTDNMLIHREQESNLFIDNTAADTQITQSSNVYVGSIKFRGKDNKEVFNIRGSLTTTGTQLQYNIRDYSDSSKHLQAHLSTQLEHSTGGAFAQFTVNNNGSGDTRTPDNRCVTKATNSTTDTYLACMGWVNNPSTSTNVLHRSGDETASGNKYFSGFVTRRYASSDEQSTYTNGFIVQDTSIDYKNDPAYFKATYPVIVKDKNGSYLGWVRHTFHTNGISVTALGAQTRNTADTATVNGSICIYAKRDGTVYTEAPTPATSDNSTKIATTAYVKNQGYATQSWVTGQGYITSASVSGLTDVTLSSLANGDVLIYNSTSQKWENGSQSGGTVDQVYDGTSANAQSGVAIEGELANYVQASSLSAVATSGDYTDLTNTPTALSDFTDDITTSTYSSSGTEPVNGQAVASAISTKQDSATALTTTNTYYDSATSTLYIG